MNRTRRPSLRDLARQLGACLLLALLGACAGPPRAVTFHAQDNPEKLSDWHLLLADAQRLTPNAGVVAYELNTPLFSDYAHKLRTVWLPEGASAHYEPTNTFRMPVGTIISKTFYYPIDPDAARGGAVVLKGPETPAEHSGQGLDLSRVRLLETRLLVHRASGWVALPYVWNAEQTEAVLSRAGDAIPLQLLSDNSRLDFTYVVPNANQCAGCHGPDNKSNRIEPIGLKARHLNRDHRYESGSENQLQYLARIGLLRDAPAPDASPRNADWQDASLPLDRRARAYLDINCGHCHNARGPANTSGLWLDADTEDNIRLGVCKPPIAAGQGTGNHIVDIVPGKPDESILSYRLGSTDPGAMMPELGRAMQHVEGLALVDAWIRAMPGDCTAVQTPAPETAL